MANNPIIPEVIEEGRRVVRPDVVNFVMQAAIAAHIAKMAKTTQALYDHAKDLEGDGLPRLMRLTVTDQLLNSLLPEAWQSAAITNDGSYTCYVRYNNLYGSKMPVNKGETLSIDMKTHKLTRLFLQCDTGESTTIRIMGAY